MKTQKRRYYQHPFHIDNEENIIMKPFIKRMCILKINTLNTKMYKRGTGKNNRITDALESK